jgi:hypothetical protein
MVTAKDRAHPQKFRSPRTVSEKSPKKTSPASPVEREVEVAFLGFQFELGVEREVELSLKVDIQSNRHVRIGQRPLTSSKSLPLRL